MREKKFLTYPVLFIGMVLLLDKIFLIPYFQDNFLQKGNEIFYRHRKELLQKLIQDKEVQERKKKLFLVLGDSRAYPLSHRLLPEKEKESWVVYNFSAPQSVPMYALQNLERILEKGIIPDIVYLSLSPEAFDDSKGFIYDPFIRLGMDKKFQEQYWDRIPFSDKYKYWIQFLFSFRRLQLDYKLLLERLQSHKLNQYHPDFNEDLLILRMGNGEYLGYAAVHNVESKLKKDALRIQSIYFNTFQLSPTQFEFVERILELSKKSGSQVYLVWPRVYRGYREVYEKWNLTQEWWKKIEALGEKYSYPTLNYNQEGKRVLHEPCELFNDASHQSVYCFVGVMEDIFALYNKTVPYSMDK